MIGSCTCSLGFCSFQNPCFCSLGRGTAVADPSDRADPDGTVSAVLDIGRLDEGDPAARLPHLAPHRRTTPLHADAAGGGRRGQRTHAPGELL